MADDVDFATPKIEEDLQRRIAAVRADILPGIEGECYMSMPKSDFLCGEFDEEFRLGDAFIEQRDLVVLHGYLTNWQREVSARLQAIQRSRGNTVTVDDDLA